MACQIDQDIVIPRTSDVYNITLTTNTRTRPPRNGKQSKKTGEDEEEDGKGNCEAKCDR